MSYDYTIRGCGSGSGSGSVEIIDGNVRSFALTGLEEDSDYTITLTAHKANRQVNSNSIFTNTYRAGTYSVVKMLVLKPFEFSS